MSQMNSSIRRTGGDMDVYTGLLAAAAVVLALGVIALVIGNSDHAKNPRNQDAGPFTIISK
jgi:hypothetical protein